MCFPVSQYGELREVCDLGADGDGGPPAGGRRGAQLRGPGPGGGPGQGGEGGCEPGGSS